MNEWNEMPLIAWIRSLGRSTDHSLFVHLSLQVEVKDNENEDSCEKYMVFLSQINGIVHEDKNPKPMRVRGDEELLSLLVILSFPPLLPCLLLFLQSKTYVFYFFFAQLAVHGNFHRAPSQFLSPAVGLYYPKPNPKSDGTLDCSTPSFEVRVPEETKIK